MQEVIAQGSAPPQGRPVSTGLLYGLRVLVVAQAAGLVTAASFAGQSVQTAKDLIATGQALPADGMLAEPHVMAGLAVHVIALLQIVAAVLVWRPGRGAGWPALASLGLFLIGMGQHFTWQLLGTHVPSGLALFGLTLAVLIWAWSPRAAVRRS
ncbi:hypothetical protein [Planobispora takensis]|uniref:Uncharacterized protein n=1 Tax=Planobispora takensis TaxID=1367882 RepID=A0A8J3T151_9ACTN|nr:hypothetical protein [Planobispora takensis]GII03411.1 hypothetical protein Pta02_54190 [Planobispora takensis]